MTVVKVKDASFEGITQLHTNEHTTSVDGQRRVTHSVLNEVEEEGEEEGKEGC